MYLAQGIRASELIKKLEAAIQEHGDCEVFAGGGDYPEGVSGVYYVPKGQGDGYIPDNSFKV